MKGKNGQISNVPSETEKFVIAWQDAENTESVARTMGWKVKSCATYAAHLRKKGVPLKRFRNHRLDYTALASMARRLAV